MALYVGGVPIVGAYLGATPVHRAYVGAQQVYAAAAPGGPPVAVDHWWDPSDAASVTETGGLVVRVDDRVGGVALEQAVASLQPTLGTLGTRQALDVPSVDGEHLAGPLTLGADLTVLSVASMDIYNHPFEGVWGIDGSIYLQVDAGNGSYRVNAGTSNAFRNHMLGSVREGATAVHALTVTGGTGGTATLYDSFAETTFATVETWAGSGTMKWGANRFGGRSIQGERGDLVVAHRALTLSEIDALGAWAAARWGTTWTPFAP